MGKTARILLAALLLVPAATSSATAAPSGDGATPHIVVFDSSVADVDAVTSARERAYGFTSRFRYRHALRGFSARLSAQQVRRLEADPAVDFVSADRAVSAAATVPLAAGEPTPPPGLRRIGTAGADTVHQASSVNVAVLDTGIDLNHPDLDSAVSGKNCISIGAPALDDNWHGTHVAGTIAAENDGAGVVGVAPGTRMYAVKVLDAAAWGSWSQIICGIDWVTATRTDADPSNDISVANMSLSGTGSVSGACSSTTDALRAAICRSTASGVTYVVAAGNNAKAFDDPAATYVPGAYPEVLTVTAMTDTDGLPGAAGPSCGTANPDDAAASFSNYATTDASAAHTIAAPGACVRSTTKGGGYTSANGTSMATPHVAGAVALCLGEAGERGPCAGLSAAQIAARMRSDAATHASGDAAYGFAGDPLRPRTGSYFGFLVWAGGAAGPPADTSAPSAPAGLVAAAGDARVSLDWSDNPAGDGVAAYVVHRSTTAAGPYAPIGQATSSAYSDGSVINGQTYHYRVTAVDAAGNESLASATATATPAPDPQPTPNIVLSATGFKVKGLPRASLSWTGGASGSFGVFRNGARIATVQSTSGNGSYEDAIGRKGGGTYSYEVCQLAADGGRGACSQTVSVTF